MLEGRYAIKRLKKVLRRIKRAEKEIEEKDKKDFESALKDLRRAFLEHKKFFRSIKDTQKDNKFAYASAKITHLFHKTESDLMKLREAYNDQDFNEAHSIIERMEKIVIWEIRHKRREKTEKTLNKTNKKEIRLVLKADRLVSKIIKQYGLQDPVDFIEIEHAKAEKEKFLKRYNENPNDHSNNPQFVYKITPKLEAIYAKASKVNDMMAELKQLKFNFTQGAGYLLVKKIENLKLLVKLVRSIGSPDVTKYSLQVYGRPTTQQYNEAFHYLEHEAAKVKAKETIDLNEAETEIDKKDVSVDEFVEQAKIFMKEADLDWKVVVKTGDDMPGSAKVVNLNRELWINKDSNNGKFSKRQITKTLVHELGVHAARYENGLKGKLKFLTYGTSGYLATEEGLTSYFEKKHKVNMKLFEFKARVYVIAEEQALRGSFFDVFSLLVGYKIDQEVAYEITTRVKRGLRNTAQKGGFMKDHVYFVGEKLIEEFIAAGGVPADIMYGKISISDIPHLIKEYEIKKSTIA